MQVTENTIKALLPKNEAGFFEISRLLIYSKKEFSSYLKSASGVKMIGALGSGLGLKICGSNHITVSTMKSLPQLMIFKENPKAIYLHPELIDGFLYWCYFKNRTDLIEYLKKYTPHSSKQNNPVKKLWDYTTEELNLMVLERLRGTTYGKIGARFYCHRDTARKKILKVAHCANITIPCRQKRHTDPIIQESSKLLWFANVAITPTVLGIANELMNNPRRASVIRLSDELQIIISNGCRILNPGHTMEEATTWRRSQFWDAEDLHDFRREVRQRGESAFEYTWQSFSPSDPNKTNDLEFTTRYKLFDGNDGNFYQLSENLGMREINCS